MAINVIRNLVSFLFVHTAVDWVAARGWLEAYMVIFMLVTLSMILATPFYFFGTKLRAMSSNLERFLQMVSRVVQMDHSRDNTVPTYIT